VPLGDVYLELVAVEDEREAAGSTFGRWVAHSAPSLMGWCVRPPSLDAAAARLDLTVSAGSRPTATGETRAWRFAGFEQAAAEPVLPFFIEWSRPASFPGRLPARRGNGPIALTELVLAGDPGRLERWLGAGTHYRSAFDGGLRASRASSSPARRGSW
jgi:hypothetical protein